MPRIKEERDNRPDSSKKMTTRSKALVKPKDKFLSSQVTKAHSTRAIVKAKPLKSASQQKKKDTDVNGNKENFKAITTKNSAGDMENKKKTAKQNTQKRIVVEGDLSEDSIASSTDSKDDNDSEDTYEPDTEDEEEYRKRSYCW